MIDALRTAGLDPSEQALPTIHGANVLATLPGEIDRWVLVAAHYDHLGAIGSEIFRGADDNAAAVGILVEVARGLAARRPSGRGVIVAAFDAEEPPHFLSGTMGSEHFARSPTVALDKIDLMICMDLVGHTLGPAGLPDEIGQSLFALGAERGEGVSSIVDRIATSEPGVIVRRADAEIIPPLSDYAPFWDRSRPFVFLTGGRSRVYHTPDDVVSLLDMPKIEATARWLERFVRASCAIAGPVAFRAARDDASTLAALAPILASLAPFSAQAAAGAARLQSLRGVLEAGGTLPEGPRLELITLLGKLESALA